MPFVLKDLLVPICFPLVISLCIIAQKLLKDHPSSRLLAITVDFNLRTKLRQGQEKVSSLYVNFAKMDLFSIAMAYCGCLT